MPLGTLEHTPPPFFRQGPSALTKLVCCSALAVFLMAADSRLAITPPLRAAVATVLLPVQRVLLVPVRAVEGGAVYLRGLEQAVSVENEARAELVAQAERVARADVLAAENARLRGLLDLRPRLGVRTQAAEVLYEARDPFSRKVVVDRGQAHGVSAGAPVINEDGVLGQVTRVYPLSSEVTLLTDKDAAIPVLNTRTRQRGAAYGANAGAGMELRFMPSNVDVEVGDLMATSGVDGIYPPGLPVARVVEFDRRGDGGFARIALAPLAASDGVRHVLVLDPVGLQLPGPPAPDAEVKPLTAPAGGGAAPTPPAAPAASGPAAAGPAAPAASAPAAPVTSAPAADATPPAAASAPGAAGAAAAAAGTAAAAAAAQRANRPAPAPAPAASRPTRPASAAPAARSAPRPNAASAPAARASRPAARDPRAAPAPPRNERAAPSPAPRRQEVDR